MRSVIASPRLRSLVRESPVGVVALLLSVFTGSLYLATVLVPDLLFYREFVGEKTGWILIPGSGIAILLVLFSFALERRLGPAKAAGLFLLVTENLGLIMMPVWTVMVLPSISSWLAAVYVISFLIALVLLAWRLFLPKTSPAAPRL